jgi:hypothetical protein
MGMNEGMDQLDSLGQPVEDGKGSGGYFNPMSLDQADALVQMQQSLLENPKVAKRNDPKIYEGEDHFKKLFTFI